VAAAARDRENGVLIEGFSVALHLPVGAGVPPASIGHPGGWAGVKERDYVLNNLFSLVQALLNYVLSLTGGVLPIGL
jgi:hypothetical protein